MEEKQAPAPLIHSKMLEVFGKIEAIEKSKKAEGGGMSYKFRGIDDIYNALHKIFKEVGIYNRSEIVSAMHDNGQYKNGGGWQRTVVKVRWYFVASDGSETWSEAIGIGMDSGDKDGNKAMTVAHKYTLLQVFLIPTSDQDDPDGQIQESKGKGRMAAGAAAQALQAPAGEEGDVDKSVAYRSFKAKLNAMQAGPSAKADLQKVWIDIGKAKTDKKITAAEYALLAPIKDEAKKRIEKGGK